MDTTVIVALPAEDDKVNRISSEKGAHLTLCFLGPTADLDLETIVQFVQHAASQLSPFGLEVDYRGTLGPDDADVLFFKKDSWSFPRIKDFRGHLLQNEAIEKAYLSQQQYPEWTPHLTLGYPATPAHKDDSEHTKFHYVEFDRIAVWSADSEGPEFRLKYAEDSLVEAGMSHSMTELGALMATAIFSNEPAVEHYGVKGMRWGVIRANKAQAQADRFQKVADKHQARADRNAGKLGNGLTIRAAKTRQKQADAQQKYATKLQQKVDAKTAARLEKKQSKEQRKAQLEATKKAHAEWKAKAGGTEMANAVYEKAAKDFEKTAEIINNDSHYKGKNVHDGSILARQYQTTMNHYFNQHLAQASVDLTINDQGRAYIYQIDNNTGLMSGREYRIDPKSISHSQMEDGFKPPDYEITYDDLGHAVGFKVVEKDLFHYGVKGMRWGVTTKDRAAQRTPQPVTVTQKKPGKFAKTDGGQNLPLHPDAKEALITRQKAKASTTDALSNAELRLAVQRMQLEQQYSQLAFQNDRRSRGARFVAGLFGVGKYGGKVKFDDINESNGRKVNQAIKDHVKEKQKRFVDAHDN